MTKVSVGRGFVVGTGALLVLGGGFFLWQMAFQGTGPCYYLPALSFQVLPFLQSYQAGCPYGAVPNYTAGDLALILIVTGFALTLVRFNRKDVSVG